MITYLMNGATLPGIDCRQGKQTIELCRTIKKSHSAANLCTDNMQPFYKFVDQIFKLSWEETPNYKELMTHLEGVVSLT